MPRKHELKFQKKKTLGDGIFLFLDLNSAWPNYKNSPIFIQGGEI
jgi:hypothetical protein